MKKERNINFELMRIVSMFLIIIWHIIMHGNVINNCMNPAIKTILEIIQFLIIVHVNSFVLLSGYYQSKSVFKLSKAFRLLLQVIFYSISILCVAIILGWVQEYSIVTFINNMNLSSLDNYWFIKTYFVMYLFSDYINKFINRLDRLEYKNFLIVSFIVLSVLPSITGYKFLYNDGYSFFNFIYLYMIGGYMRKYPIKDMYHFKKMSMNGYRILLFISFLGLGMINYWVHHFAIEINGMSNIFTEISSRIQMSYLKYSSPAVIIQSVLFVEFFRTLHIKTKWISSISSCAFGIYLLHDNEIVRKHLYKILRIDNGAFSSYKIFPKILLVGIFIFIVCFCIEWLRQKICHMIRKWKIVDIIVVKFKNFIQSFHFKINW